MTHLYLFSAWWDTQGACHTQAHTHKLKPINVRCAHVKLMQFQMPPVLRTVTYKCHFTVQTETEASSSTGNEPVAEAKINPPPTLHISLSRKYINVFFSNYRDANLSQKCFNVNIFFVIILVLFIS